MGQPPHLTDGDTETRTAKAVSRVIRQQFLSVSITGHFLASLLPQIEWSRLPQAATELDTDQEVIPMSRVSHSFQLCFTKTHLLFRKHPHVF